MTTESAQNNVKGASSSLFPRILIAISLLLLIGFFMALGACSTSDNKVAFTGGGPTSPTAASGDATVILKWTAVAGASSYKVYWNTKGGVTTADESIQVTDTTYTHKDLTNGTRYYYRICGLTGGGVESPLSEETSAMPSKPKPATPVGLTATASSSQVALAWQAVDGAVSYNLYWNTAGQVTLTDQHLSATGVSYVHTGLTNGRAYHYRVTSVNVSGESDLSDEVSATPIASSPPPPGGGGTSYNSGKWYEFPTSGKTDWSKGVITFSITGLDYSMLPIGKDYFLFMARFVTPNGNEGNFELNLADLSTRLISQRFDGGCSGRTFCEQQNIGNVSWVSSEVYSMRFEWNDTIVQCDIKDSAGNIVFSGSVNTWGAYASVDFVRAGNGVIPPYPGVPFPITVISPVLH
jgi:hypothetical protein